MQIIRLIKKIIKKIKRNLYPEKILYKIGNVKFHNSKIDTLIPQFIEIGENFVSAPDSLIIAHDASLFVHTGMYRIEKVIIGDNVFLGANAIILPGVKVGDNSIIGAGSVVTKEVPPNTVVAGNPAKKICTTQEYIKKCKIKKCLFDAPVSFNKVWSNKRLDEKDIIEFQKNVINRMKNYNENN